MWDVYSTEEYLIWFSNLSDFDKEEINYKVRLLEEFGPNLGRPHADTLKGSSVNNLKELRIKTNDHLFRIAFYFDVNRNGLLLTGGDKKCKDEKLFYKDLITHAEELIKLYKNYNC
ncbi:MAG: type II toxin-antitoxin system RelE/ParE family toxin [Treponema sp.]|nr:type II toxin-antitoxin system RelE/ParE family toxin [Treponema sp.]